MWPFKKKPKWRMPKWEDIPYTKKVDMAFVSRHDFGLCTPKEQKVIIDEIKWAYESIYKELITYENK